MSRRRKGDPVGPTGVLVSTARPNTPRWLRDRRDGIGGSEAPAVLGLCPYRTPLDVWAEKTGRVPLGDDGPPSEAAYFGHVLETVVASEWMARQPAGRWRLVGCPGIAAHRDDRWRRCTVDRLVATADSPVPVALLECKTSGAGGSEWGSPDGPPVHALVQVQHSLAVLGYPSGWVAALVGGRGGFSFRSWLIERDDEFCALLVEAEREFWRSVETGVEPRARDRRDESAVRALYRHSHPGEVVTLPVEAADDLDEYDRAHLEESAARARKADARARLLQHLGEAENGLCPDTGRLVCSWRGAVRESLDAAALRENEPEIAAKYTRTTPVRTFRTHD